MSDECIIHDMREICKMLFAISCIWLVTDAVSTLQLAILLWIAVSPNDAADPICFIYRIRSSPCRKMTGASFPQGRAYGGQDTVLLQIHLSGRTRETLIKSLSDLALVLSYKARNKPPRIASYLRRVMTKHWMKNTCQVGLCDLISVSQRRTMLLCTHPQVGCTWGSLRNQNSLYKRIPRLAGSCKSGVFVSLQFGGTIWVRTGDLFDVSEAL